jgi:hypothetical protein
MFKSRMDRKVMVTALIREVRITDLILVSGESE